MTVSITWHGHATLSLSADDVTLVIDPYFAPDNPAARTSVEDVAADYILVTHGHGDHVHHAERLAALTGAPVIAKPEICKWLRAKGVKDTHGMNTGGSFTFPFGQVTMTPAFHSSGLPDGTYGGEPGGFVVQLEGKRIYVAGDTSVFSDMALIGRHGLDVAILPIGDNFTMGPDDALLALGYLKPAVAIPYHYNTWSLIEVDVEAWSQECSNTQPVKPVVLSIDKPYSL